MQLNKIKLFTGLGYGCLAGTVVTAYVAGKNSYKCKNREYDILSNKAKYKPLTKFDPCVAKIKAYSPYVLPVVLTCAASGVFFGLAMKEQEKKIVLAVGAAAAAKEMLSLTQEKIKEVAGEEVATAVNHEVNQAKASKHDIPADIQAEMANATDESAFKQLFYDEFTGEYFRSTVDDIRKAETVIYKQMMNDRYGYAELDDFRFKIGLKCTPSTKFRGFLYKNYKSDKSQVINLNDTILSPQGIPAIVVKYNPDFDPVLGMNLE